MSRKAKVWVPAFSLALVLAVVWSKAQGGTPAGAKYMGSKLCQACHQSKNAAMIQGWAASTHARALWKIDQADATHVVLAKFDEKSPFPKEKIAYVLGMGQKAQAYLDADLKVLPGMWQVKEQAWAAQPAVDAKQDCLGCHTTGYDPATAKWTELSVGCEMCHGPGSAHMSAADKKATITNPQTLEPLRQAMICGRCHAKGKTSDGKLTFAASFCPGDDLEQTLTLATGVAPGERNAQYNEMRLGGGKHLAAGVQCTSCHDPHGSQAKQLRAATVKEVCLKCHQGKLQGPQHSDDVLKSVSCETCHMPKDSHAFTNPKQK
jgi:predicted CXXCH cytochrome family protein